MVGKTKAQSTEDKKRLVALGQIGCVPCMLDGSDGIPATVQHVTSGGRRLEDQHQKTYGSCPWHHLGQVPDVCDGKVSLAEDWWGPSFAHNKRKFVERYGDEAELIRIADILVKAHYQASERGHYMLPIEFGKLARIEVVLRYIP